MSTTTVEIPTSVVEAVRRAIVERDAGMKLAEDADTTGWNTSLVDQAIRAFAAEPRPFSANDLRHLIDDVPSPLMGARFMAARKRGQIRRVGYVTSTKTSTHGHEIKQWMGVTPDDEA